MLEWEKGRSHSEGGAGRWRSLAAGHARAIVDLARLLNPWPDYAKPTDELVDMLTAEFPEERRHSPRVELDYLLKRHRQLLCDATHSFSLQEWSS